MSDRGYGAIALSLSILLVTLAVVSFLWFPFVPWLEQRQAGEEIVRDEMSAEQALDNYRWFRSQWFDIEAQRGQIENAYEEDEVFHATYGEDPTQWSREAEIQHGRIHERIIGNQNMLEGMVGEYNARSADATRAIWKCNLPFQVDDRFAIAGPPGAGSPEEPKDQYVPTANPGQRPPPAEQCDSLPSQAEA